MTDHMFLMNYDKEHGWHDGRIVPYAPFQIEPACMVLHYAQEIFEGMKCLPGCRRQDSQLFRPRGELQAHEQLLHSYEHSRDRRGLLP